MAQRRYTAGSLALTPARMLALTIGPSPLGPQERDETLEALWWRHRERLLATQRHGSMPWAFWRFEGPVELRGERAVLHPVEDEKAVERQREDLERRRADWLAVQAEHGGAAGAREDAR